MRPILDLKALNCFVRVQKFLMESIRMVVASLHQGDFLASIDIKDAYLHIPIWVQHQRFLCFSVREEHYQFVTLPFGLSSAPWFFTKVLAPVLTSEEDCGTGLPGRPPLMGRVRFCLDGQSGDHYSDPKGVWLASNLPEVCPASLQKIRLSGSALARVFLSLDKLQKLHAVIHLLLSRGWYSLWT